MVKENCWEHKNCGRQPGGAKVGELGICIAAMNAKLNGEHAGKNAGRSCWVIAGTLCGGKAQGSFASKLVNCLACEFYNMVKNEEGKEFKNAVELLKKLK